MTNASMAKTANQRTRILVAEHHAIVRAGMKHLLETQADMYVVAEAEDGNAAVKLTIQTAPDVLLMDVSMPEKSGIEVLKDLAQLSIETRPILLTASIHRNLVPEAVQLGARGIILKATPVQLLFKCIRSVMEGEYWIGHDGVADLAGALRQFMRESQLPQPQRPFGLTAREFEIVQAILDGDSNRDVAAKLNISHQTVKNHMTAIFDKVGVSSRLELALLASRHIETRAS